MTRLTIDNVPEELKRKFKGLCGEKGSTMREELLSFMRKEVDKAKKGKLISPGIKKLIKEFKPSTKRRR